MAAEMLSKHLSFMRDLEVALEEALTKYDEADESDLDELRHMKREVQQARRSIFIYVEKQRAVERRQAKKLEELFLSGLKSDHSAGLLRPETAVPA